jgi:hypothetical protein
MYWRLVCLIQDNSVQYADNNRVLDLHFGWGNNGNEV